MLLFIYLVQYPYLKMIPSNHPYKTYLLKSMATFLNHFVLRLKIKATGLEHVPKEGRLVIYANHKSYTDAFVLMEKLPRSITLTPKKSVMKIPVVGAWLKTYDVFPINRSSARETAKDMEHAIETVKKGYAMSVFPEGSISNRLSEEIGLMKPGSFKLALKAEADILIVRFDGNHLVRKRAPFLKTRRYITVLPVYRYEDFKNLSTQEIADEVMHRINQAKPNQKA
jgi:1-acyl-sn-glycerol-3-phosphate acyltransferase